MLHDCLVPHDPPTQAERSVSAAHPPSIMTSQGVHPVETKELISYLTTVCNLEGQIFELEQLSGELKKQERIATAPISSLTREEMATRMSLGNTPTTQEAEKAAQEKVEHIKHLKANPPNITDYLKTHLTPLPKEPVTSSGPVEARIKAIAGGAVVIFSILLTILSGFDTIAIGIAVMGVLVGGFISLSGIITVNEIKKYNDAVEKAALIRQEQQKKSDAEYAAYHTAEIFHKGKISDAEHELEQAREAHSRLHLHALTAVSEITRANQSAIQETLESLYQTREQIYAQNVLFPKYRTFPCVSTMLEYLQASRVTALEGHDGAYNLYESEMRMNMVITQLDNITAQLDQIRQNQFYLYQAVSNVNKTLQQTNEQLRVQINLQQQLLDNQHKIMENQQSQIQLSAVTACCTAAIAANTEAIKYLTLIG